MVAVEVATIADRGGAVDGAIVSVGSVGSVAAAEDATATVRAVDVLDGAADVETVVSSWSRSVVALPSSRALRRRTKVRTVKSRAAPARIVAKRGTGDRGRGVVITR